MALQSNTDLRLLYDFLPASPVFWPLSPQFAILHLLISVCKHFHIPSCYPCLTNAFHLPRSIPLNPTVPKSQFRFTNSQLFYCDRLSACHPTPNLDFQCTVFIILGQCDPTTPPHTAYLFSVSWTAVGLIYSPFNTQKFVFIYTQKYET